MKKFKSLTLVALGLLTLASCSNDDLLNEKVAQTEDLSEYDLVVYHQFDGNATENFTRGYMGEKAENASFTKMDRIHVFDDELHKFDIYKFAACAQTPGTYGFHRENLYANVNGQAKYALYPHEDVIRGYWKYNESSEMKATLAEININPNLVYDATIFYDKDDEGNLVKSAIYKDVMPMWGTVEWKGDHLQTEMRYLTAGFHMPLLKYAGNATAIRIQVRDAATKELLDIAGLFEAKLSEGKQEMIVDKNCVAKYLEEPEAACFSAKPKGSTATLTDKSKAIYVDLTHASKDLESLTAAEQERACIWVPLPDTNGKEVIIEVSATNDDFAVEFGYPDYRELPDADRNRVVKNSNMWACNYKDIWKSKKAKALIANKLYGPSKAYNFTVGGIDTNAINEALEEAEPENKQVILTTEDVITICGTDNTIIIPTKRNTDTEYIKIDMSKGLAACLDGETLKVVYEDPEQPYPGELEIVGYNVEKDKKLKLDADIPATSFAIAGDAFKNNAKKTLDIDAKAFSLGNDEDDTEYLAVNLLLSDNVEELTIAEKAILRKEKGATENADLVVGPKSKMEKFNVFGIVDGVDFDAHEAGEELDVVVSGHPAVYVGEIRTTGKIEADDFAMIVAVGAEGKGGVAATKDVTVRDKAFIIGSVFSREGDIDIKNTNADATLGNGDLDLGQYIYEEFGLSIDLSSYLGTTNKPYTYGPLYAEGSNNGSGRVLVEAENSHLFLTPGYNIVDPTHTVPAAVLDKLNQHAKDATKYSVYAKGDIQISGDQVECDKGTKMWSENDIHLSGKTKANNNNQLDADHDFIIDGESKASTVNVGHKASVSVDPQDGMAVAITTLNFIKNADDVNQLDLNEGYIGTVNNGKAANAFDVELRFDENKGAYAAIGTVTSPDNLLPKNESKWNGKQIPDALKKTYVKTDEPNIWTATQLAAQTTGITTSEPNLRSDIDLMKNEWDGILAEASAAGTGSEYVFEGNGNYVENFVIVSFDKRVAGFIREATVPVTVQNLDLNEVTSNIAGVPSQAVAWGTGAVVGRANDAVTLSRVSVKLGAGNFGSDGTKNIKTANVGGAIGVAAKMATLTGVKVDAKQATLAGWYNLGGLIARAAGGAVIEDAVADDAANLEPVQTKVIAPKAFNVTFLNTTPPLYNVDLNQGKTGLYIGSADLSKSINIQATGNTYKDVIKVTGKADETVVYESGTATLEGTSWEGRYTFSRKDANNKFIQTMIGQSGITADEFNHQKNVKIGSVFFNFKRGLGMSTADLTGTLYNVIFTGEKEVTIP